MHDIDELVEKVERLESAVSDLSDRLSSVEEEVNGALLEMSAQTFPKGSPVPLSGLPVEIGFCRERLDALETVIRNEK